MQVSYNEAHRFIKDKLGIQLYPHQELILKAFCNGLRVRTGRGVDRTFVADAFGKYIAYLYGQNDLPGEVDLIIPTAAAVHVGLTPNIQRGSIQTSTTISRTPCRERWLLRL